MTTLPASSAASLPTLLPAAQLLAQLTAALAGGGVRVVDLTHTLAPEFPQIVLPPEFGQVQPFRIEEVSRYD